MRSLIDEDIDDIGNIAELAKSGLMIRDMSAPDHWRSADDNLTFVGKKTILILPGIGTHDTKAANGMCKVVEGLLNEDEQRDYQICSMYYNTGLMERAPTILRAQAVFDQYIVPLVANKDENGDLHRISAMQAAHNLRNLKIVTHCYGGDILHEIDRQLNELMTDIGYLTEERKFVQRQLFAVQHNNIDADLEKRKFRSTQLIRVSSADEVLGLRDVDIMTFRHRMINHHPDDKDYMYLNLADNAAVLLVGRIGMRGVKEHDGGYWKSGIKLAGAQKEEEIFQLIFHEALSADYLIENPDQLLANALKKHQDKQELAEHARQTGAEYMADFACDKQKFRQKFQQMTEQIAAGEKFDVSGLDENMLMGKDEHNKFLLDYALASQDNNEIINLFQKMEAYLPIRSNKAKCGWEKWPMNHNQIEALDKVYWWNQFAINVDDVELFKLFAAKNDKFHKLNYAKASEEIMLAAAGVYKQKAYPDNRLDQVAYAKGLLTLYSQAEQNGVSSKRKVQQALENIVALPSEKRYGFVDGTCGEVERLCSQYGAEKLHEAMIAAKTKPAVASRRFNVR